MKYKKGASTFPSGLFGFADICKKIAMNIEQADTP